MSMMGYEISDPDFGFLVDREAHVRTISDSREATEYWGNTLAFLFEVGYPTSTINEMTTAASALVDLYEYEATLAEGLQ